MRWLIFLSRLAFISNLFFLAAVSIQLGNWLRNEELVSTILIIGFAFAAILNPIVNVSYLVLLLRKKMVSAYVPKWLAVANALFLLLQIFYIVYLNSHPSN